MIHFLPIEPLEERYSKQMLRWVTDALRDMIFDYQVYLPESSGRIKIGQFLDCNETINFKAQQIAMVAEAFRMGNVSSGDVFLLGDLWFPGFEGILYIAELNKLKVKIAGWHYAGMFDEHDYLTKNLGTWARQWEVNMLQTVDAICVGSLFHKEMIASNVPGAKEKIFPFGLAWVPEAERYWSSVTDKIVVFPHRVADEKNPAAFFEAYCQLHERFPEWRWIVSTNAQSEIVLPNGIELLRHESKEAYYQFLSRCAIFYSSAFQETFGYALHEAMSLGLHVVAPARCCYPEKLQGYAGASLYNDSTGRDILAARMDGFTKERTIKPFRNPRDYHHREFLRLIQALS